MLLLSEIQPEMLLSQQQMKLFFSPLSHLILFGWRSWTHPAFIILSFFFYPSAASPAYICSGKSFNQLMQSDEWISRCNVIHHFDW